MWNPKKKQDKKCCCIPGEKNTFTREELFNAKENYDLILWILTRDHALYFDTSSDDKEYKTFLKPFLRVQLYKSNRDALFVRVITWTFITSIGTIFPVYLTSFISSVITYPGARQRLALVFFFYRKQQYYLILTGFFSSILFHFVHHTSLWIIYTFTHTNTNTNNNNI